MQGHDSEMTVAKSSISEMRAKIGYAPLQSLMAIDGSNLEVADEPDNIKTFGYPGSRTGHAGYPQAQCAVLVECC